MFKKGEYIVLTGTMFKEDPDFPRNFVFKQRDNLPYLRVYKDARGRENGWALVEYLTKNTRYEWRYATTREAYQYEIKGGSYDVTTLPKQPENLINYSIY